MLVAIGGQHALAKDCPRGEAGVVNREPFVVAHSLDGELAARHPPRTKGWHPGDRFVLAQFSQHLVGAVGQLFDRDAGADWKLGLGMGAHTAQGM